MTPRKKNAEGSGIYLAPEPMAFISYTTFDNLHDQQAIAHFCERLSNEVRMQTGKPFQIFRDKKDIRWGENWRARIEQGLDASTFLIPILTPSYFQSQACQEEYNRFRKREEQLKRNDLILPVYYVECDELENRELCDANPWAKDMISRQYENWRHLRWEPSDSPAVGRAFEHMAKQIKQAMNAVYRGEFADIGAVIKTIHTKETAESATVDADITPVVRAIDLLIKQAVKDRASDVHLEPKEDRMRVRFRIDGILHEVMSLPLSAHSAIISRIKIMAGMNIEEILHPQYGYISFKSDNFNVNIRVTTFNTVRGETVALHIPEKTFAPRTLPELGFSRESLELYSQMLENHSGMILVTGPTGSGKTTTLYASINHLSNTQQKIISIEDHIEFNLNNVSQIQVNPAAGVTFGTGLRAAMQLDSDIILLGNILDKETAQLAVQLALTGRLVLSSIQSSDTINAIYRLIDLEVEPFHLASAIIGIVAQRVVRRVCSHCSRYTVTTPKEERAYENETNEKRTEFLYGEGCAICSNTGYLGTTAIFEVMTLSDSIRHSILSGASSDDIRKQAVKEGMISLTRDGMLKVKMGITTPYEVIRNSPPSAKS